MSAALWVFKLSIQSVCQLQQHKIEVSFEIHRVILSVNSCGKSFHIEVGFGICNVPVFHLTW